MESAWLRGCVLFAAAYSCVGCATLFNGNRDRVHIYARTGVRSVVADDRPIPVRVAPDNPAAYEVTLSVDRPHQLAITTGAGVHRVETSRSVGAGWVVLDLFCHPLICPIVDAATGAWSSFDPIYLLDPTPGPLRAPALAPSSAPPTPTPAPNPSGPTMLEPIIVAPWQQSPARSGP